MSKTFFSLFTNEGDKADQTKYKKYTGKDAEGKAEFDEVTANYRITSTEGTVSGSAIKDRSQAGNPVIRLNFSAKGESTVYYNGTLNMAKNKSKDAQPDMFGTASDKGGNEMDLACWFKETKNGQKYMSCNMQEPYVKETSGQGTASTGAASDDMDDDIPF
ncbi:MAG: hypothetical protein B7X93_03020 [Hydrogenophilales bacterium 17-61-9]|nr:MAG: hypothetical protein B7X93_03020 [Hydrogenophilales bacterium 17-61-9]